MVCHRLLVGLILSGLLMAGDSGFPPHGDAMLELADAVWSGGADEKKTVFLRLQRLDGAWDPVVVGRTVHGQNATHYGFITGQAQADDGTQELTIRLVLRPDRWIGGSADNAYRLRLRHDGTACSGSWVGLVRGREAGGGLSGTWETVERAAGWAPPPKGEHPRLLIGRQELERLRERAATPAGQEVLAGLGSGLVGRAFAYALRGDPALGEGLRADLAAACDPYSGWWYHTGGVQHGPAVRIVEHLIAYDLAYDLCTPAMHAGMRQNLREVLDLYYWGADNTLFNPNDTSNWSLLYRSALGLMGLTLLDEPAPTGPLSAARLRNLTPLDASMIAEGLPVNRWTEKEPRLRSWLFAGPVPESRDDDAFAALGGLARQRPEPGQGSGALVWRAIAETELRATLRGLKVIGDDIDLAALSRRQPFTGCYFAAVLEIPEAGYYRLVAPDSKGCRQLRVLIAGHPLEDGDHVHLAAGRYPLAARAWTEPVGNWEPLVFAARLVRSEEAVALAWQADREAVQAADAFCGADWRARLVRETGRDPIAWAYARMAADRAERYLLRGIGDGGWDQEGGYTRHAFHLAMPFARCYRNVFGRDLRGAKRLGACLVLSAARTIFTETGTICQTYSSGGGPMDLSLFARGYGLVPPPQQPAVLWSWKRSEVLAQAGRYRDLYGIRGEDDDLSRVMRFLDRPADAPEADPDEVLPRVLADRQKGGFVLRNRWQDGDDCVVQCFANMNQPGGTWSSSEAGIFRIDGLGASWAVRGEGYGQGTSRERLDPSQYENLVDVAEHFLPGATQAQGRIIHEQVAADGSGVISLDLDQVYRHQPRSLATGSKKPERPQQDGQPVDLGIRAVRSLGVDYSGASGVPCLVAVADRLTGTKGQNTWTMATPREHRVETDGASFRIVAANGATLQGTVVRPVGATVRQTEHTHSHEINYQGDHAHRRFDTTLIQVPGGDRDQEFLVVMTLQRGEAPPVQRDGDGRSARIGGRKVGFDGQRITWE
jgi:hypothetical protein